MNQSNEILSIADPTVPNAGRIYDFLIGGHHNFEVDRKAAQQILQLVPFMPRALRLIRWFLGEATRRLLSQGYSKFLDFASGLPVMDQIHELSPPGTKVVYSDIDPVTVEYAREILKNNPDVRYLQCDAGKPEDLLESAVVRDLFGEDRTVAIGFNGVAYFLPDDRITHSLRTLYEWAGEGSKLFLSDADSDDTEITDKLWPLFELYTKIGQPITIRSRKRLEEMARPWKVDEPGFLTLDKWVGIGKQVTEEEMSEWGGRGFYGVIFSK